MGAFLDKPIVEKEFDEGNGNGLQFAAVSMQGWRQEMEDAHTAVTALHDPVQLSRWSFFGVFDGHAGHAAAQKSAKQILSHIVGQQNFKAILTEEKIGDGGATEAIVDKVKEAIRVGFLAYDTALETSLNEEGDHSGSTAICCLLTPSHIYLINCGDSRGFICASSEVVLASIDHKPALHSERARIEGAGSEVFLSRINGNLGVSRSLGDFEYKRAEGLPPEAQAVSPEPEIFVRKRNNETDEFLVLCCDGIWDVCSNEEVCQFLHHSLQVTHDLKQIISQLLDISLHRGSKDNMTVILITLPSCPTINEEMARLDTALNAKIVKLAEEHIKSTPERNSVTVGSILRHIETSDTTLPNLPPGVGLDAKYDVVRQVMHKLMPERADIVESASRGMLGGGQLFGSGPLTEVPAVADEPRQLDDMLGLDQADMIKQMTILASALTPGNPQGNQHAPLASGEIDDSSLPPPSSPSPPPTTPTLPNGPEKNPDIK